MPGLLLYLIPASPFCCVRLSYLLVQLVDIVHVCRSIVLIELLHARFDSLRPCPCQFNNTPRRRLRPLEAAAFDIIPVPAPFSRAVVFPLQAVLKRLSTRFYSCSLLVHVKVGNGTYTTHSIRVFPSLVRSRWLSV